ncbi:DUF5131 family protein [Amycolatopsis sp. NPDC059090]|uniref:DUF5131 family protein n=1 Tax=Amycolatopsis sp. NPDC059090 TaxID=3346723 RepID=UPI00366C99C0
MSVWCSCWSSRGSAGVADGSAIEWTEATWNPMTGCDRVSAGCDNCYALTLAKRLKAAERAREAARKAANAAAEAAKAGSLPMKLVRRRRPMPAHTPTPRPMRPQLGRLVATRGSGSCPRTSRRCWR